MTIYSFSRPSTVTTEVFREEFNKTIEIKIETNISLCLKPRILSNIVLLINSISGKQHAYLTADFLKHLREMRVTLNIINDTS